MAGPLDGPPTAGGAGASAQSLKLDALREASSQLDERLRKDVIPDLNDLCRNRLEALQRGQASPADADASASFNFLRKDAFLSLPEFIFQQYDSVQSRSFMGIFPEVNRVWISIDNRLYLWNYEDIGEQPINTFDDQEQIIIAAALVRPVPGVFLEQIEYVLVVATPLEIILLGVAFSQKAQGNKPRGDMAIYRTEMSIASDGLYEIVYDAQEGWFTSKIRKINHTANALYALVSPIIPFRHENAIKLIAIDNRLNALYTVSPANVVTVYSLGGQRTLKEVAKMTDLLNQVNRFSTLIPQSALDDRTFEIVSLHAVPRSESTVINLVAITATGIRLYFSTTAQPDRYASQPQSAPSGLAAPRLVFARGPPFFSQGLSQYNMVGSAKIHEAFYANGLTIAAQAFTDEVDRIIGATLNVGLISKQTTSMHFSEISSSVDIDGKTWAIAEAPTKFANAAAKRLAGASGLLNELATQFEYPARKFFLLTNTGLSTITKLRPVDLLIQVIAQSRSDGLRAIDDFFNVFGRDQSCAMCLAIACGHSSIKSGPADLITHDAVNIAVTAFFNLGGKPIVDQSQPVQSGGGALGVPVSAFQIRNSDKQQGFMLYLGRILKPIWKTPLIRKKKTADGVEKFETALAVEDLLEVQTHLISLQRFLIQYPVFSAPPTPDSCPPQLDFNAWKTEQETLANAHSLIRQTLETIAFVLLLIDHQFSTIVEGLTDAEKRELQGFTFESLVSTTKGRDVSKILMASLVNKQIEKDAGVETITKALQQRCPSICQNNDVVLYRGMEFIQHARQSANPNDQQAILGEALHMFLTVVKTMNFEKLREIVEHFKSLRFFNGVIDLALAYAAILEPAEVSLDPNVLSSTAFIRRQECYQLIFNMLGNMEGLLMQSMAGKPRLSIEEAHAVQSQVLARALQSTDRAFHQQLYSWFIGKGLNDQLLQIQSQFLEAYLSEVPDDLVRLELLWQFYVRNSRFGDAARVLSDMSQLPSLPLVRRLEYLTKAVTNAKSSSGFEYAGNQELLSQLTDELDVARVQLEIYQRLQSMVDVDDYLDELNSGLLDVTRLFHAFAKPFQMHDVILSILYTSDQGVQSRPIAENALSAIMLNTKEEALRSNRSPFEALSDKIKELGRRFSTNENVFPLRFLVNKLEYESFAYGERAFAPDRGWVVDTLRGFGVPFPVIFQTFHELFETKLPPWSSNDALLFLVRDIQVLLTKWLEHVGSLAATANEREEFPARTVDEAISKYLVTIREDETQLVAALHQIQARLRRSF
ncbi:Non-repetitive/WGA-negative nucleoporin C-terminal-domain-containing protein [Entophlyctis helioformis]|nr:Non-repetitive/WGA-negative nucleoporin C-terminal-domain-containing protein [Entophlyctis helioformis]